MLYVEASVHAHFLNLSRTTARVIGVFFVLAACYFVFMCTRTGPVLCYQFMSWFLARALLWIDLWLFWEGQPTKKLYLQSPHRGAFGTNVRGDVIKMNHWVLTTSCTNSGEKTLPSFSPFFCFNFFFFQFDFYSNFTQLLQHCFNSCPGIDNGIFFCTHLSVWLHGP